MQLIKVMIYLLEKPLPNCINNLIQAMFTTVLIIILVLASSSQFAISSFATSPSNMGRETEALLEWKVSLENQSQFRLSSWVGNIPSQWVGISCNNFSSISHISLTRSALKGIKAQNNMLGLGLLSKDAELSEEGQIVVRGSQLKSHK
ncbi:uncharacterized protein LOC126705637 [Quercus robur]|uniref:uncharacterized protein LOC126705637 n=1 Tax=Quercus robur TaxID=38942 RepID=UPI00216365F4|nr:uncharacterized protein LOC126705637 [Quercus robur]